MKIEFFTIDELNYFKEHCDFTEDELYLLDEKSKGKTLKETGFDIDTLKSVKRKIRKALEDREIKTMTVVEIKEYARKEMRHIRTGIKEEFKEEHYNALIYKICELLDELDDRPKGKWVKTQLGYYDDEYGWECSNCEEIYCTEYDFEEEAYNYCPNCGARMEIEKGEKGEK